MKLKYGIVALFCALLTGQAKADMYIGGLVGYGTNAGAGYSSDGGLALGATAGFQLVPNLGLGATYLHDALKSGSIDIGVSQYLVEANFFSLLFFPSGVHIGSVHTSIGNASASDMGFGLHTGFDMNIAAGISVGVAAYWTYVTAENDKHSLLNVVVPIKFHL
jgi:hypothetical protein